MKVDYIKKYVDKYNLQKRLEQLGISIDDITNKNITFKDIDPRKVPKDLQKVYSRLQILMEGPTLKTGDFESVDPYFLEDSLEVLDQLDIFETKTEKEVSARQLFALGERYRESVIPKKPTRKYIIDQIKKYSELRQAKDHRCEYHMLNVGSAFAKLSKEDAQIMYDEVMKEVFDDIPKLHLVVVNTSYSISEFERIRNQEIKSIAEEAEATFGQFMK